MMADFENVMTEICDFLGHTMTPRLLTNIHTRGEKQRKYESEHKYDLAKFGLSEADIRRDCSFYFNTFLPPLGQGQLELPSWPEHSPVSRFPV
jgi:hypothetical protein